MTDLLGAEAALWTARVNRLQAGYDVACRARLLPALQRDRFTLLWRIVLGGLAIGGAEILLLREGSAAGKWLEHPPLATVVALKTLAYTAIASVLPAVHLLGLVLPDLP